MDTAALRNMSIVQLLQLVGSILRIIELRVERTMTAPVLEPDTAVEQANAAGILNGRRAAPEVAASAEPEASEDEMSELFEPEAEDMRRDSAGGNGSGRITRAGFDLPEETPHTPTSSSAPHHIVNESMAEVDTITYDPFDRPPWEEDAKRQRLLEETFDQ